LYPQYVPILHQPAALAFSMAGLAGVKGSLLDFWTAFFSCGDVSSLTGLQGNIGKYRKNLCLFIGKI